MTTELFLTHSQIFSYKNVRCLDMIDIIDQSKITTSPKLYAHTT